MAINYHNHNINTSGTITSPSGNFTTLIVNGTSVSNFNSSISGLLPTIANSGDNRILTSTGSSVGINAESNLTFDGTNLNLNNQTASTIASFDSSKNLVSLSTTTYPSLTELSYVKGVTSAIQTQIDTKAATSTTITAGSGLAGGGSLAANRTIDIGQGDGISVSADSIAVDSTVIRTTGVQTMSGAKTFSAQTVFASGTAAAPGISIIGDTDTGIAQLIRGGESANTLSLVVGGTERMRIEPGNVKILTPTDDTAEFSISNSIDRDAYIVIDGGSNTGRSAVLEGRANGVQEWYICSTRFHEDGPNNGMALNVAGSNPMTFRTNNTEKMRITSAGSVGIGTSSPQQKFVVSNAGAEGMEIIPALNSNESRIQTYNRSTSAWNKFSINCSTFELFTNGATTTIFGNASGNVGIGTSSPAAGAVVVSRSASTGAVADIPAIVLTNRNSTNATFVAGGVFSNTYRDVADPHYSAGMWFVRSPFSSNNSSSGDIVFGTGENVVQSAFPTERMRITSAGSVGIGTSSPSTKLDVFGTAGGGATIRINDGTQDLRLYTSTGIGVIGTISNSSLGFHTNNTEKMRITSGGNVGIGTTNPTEKLHIRGAGARAYIYNTTTDAVVIIQGLTPASPWLGAGKSAVQIDVDGWGGFAWQTDVTSGAKLFKLINNGGYGASESTFITINNSGQVGIGISPSTLLHLNSLGVLRLQTGSVTMDCTPTAGATDSFVWNTSANAAYRWSMNGTERMRIESDGKLYAYNTYGTTVGATNRDLFIDSGGLIGYVSSIRASKTNITTIDNVSWLRDLTPVSFFYRRRNEDGTYSDEPDGTLDYGLIAEDVEVVAPELCFYDIIDDNPELRGVHYSKLITPMLKYIQQLEDRIASLETRLGDNV